MIAIGLGVAAAVAILLAGPRLWGGDPAVVLPPDGRQIDAHVLDLIHEHVRYVRASPNSAEARGHLGAVYAANGLYSQAERCFAHAARLAPDSGVWPFHRALALEQTGRIEEATLLLQRIASTNPAYPAVQQRLGECLLESGDLDGAGRAFQRLIASAPEEPQGYSGLGDVRLRQRDFAEAERILKKAIAVAPDDRSTRYLLGLTLRGLGKTDAARRELALGVGAKSRLLRDELSDALERYTVNLAGRLDLARQYSVGGNLPAAADVLQAAVDQRPDNCELLNNLASVYTRQGRHEEAMKLLRRAEGLGESAILTFNNMANCLLRMNRLSEAMTFAERAIQAAPEFGKSYFTMALVLKRLKQYDSAIEALERAARFDPENSRVHREIGQSFLRIRRFEMSRQHYQIAARLSPDSVHAHAGLGSACAGLGRLSEAVAALAAARELDPGHPAVLQLAELLSRSQADDEGVE
ncbi:MAG: tetratricopeptide repeat protein [Planctomycetota bacterium]|nr:tetratricopeptide repeat protein [Planctomycetota bacterium]